MQAQRTVAENSLLGISFSTISNRFLPPKTVFLYLALSLSDPGNQPSEHHRKQHWLLHAQNAMPSHRELQKKLHLC